MTTVFSNNQKFNITKSLYESIIKNNPELLQEDDFDPSDNIDLYADIFNKVYGRDWTSNEQKKSMKLLKDKGIDNTADWEKELRQTNEFKKNDNLVGLNAEQIAKQLIKQTEESLGNNYSNLEWKKQFNNLIDKVKNTKKIGNNKREVISYINDYINNEFNNIKNERYEKIKPLAEKIIKQAEEELGGNPTIQVWNKKINDLIDSIDNGYMSKTDKELVKKYINDEYIKNYKENKKEEYKNKEIDNKLFGISGQEKFNEIKTVLDKFMFDENKNQRPKGMYDLIKKVQENVKDWLVGLSFQVKFSLKGGDRKYYFDKIMYQEWVNTVKDNNFDVNIDGFPVWKFFKSSDMNNIWKNILTIDCRTDSAFRVVNDQIQKQSSYYNEGKIRIIPKSFPSAFKTNSMIYAIIEKYREPEDDEKIDTLTNNKEIKKGLERLKRIYFIFVTEGMFEKGKFLSKIGNTALDVFKNPEKLLGKSNNKLV